MLKFQLKVNRNGQAVEFINTEHDAEEFNSCRQELVNLIQNAGGTPTPLVNYLTDNRHQISQAMRTLPHKPVEYSGSVDNMTILDIDGNPSKEYFQLYTLIPFRSNTINDGQGFDVTIDSVTYPVYMDGQTQDITPPEGTLQTGDFFYMWFTGAIFYLIKPITGERGGIHRKTISYGSGALPFLWRSPGTNIWQRRDGDFSSIQTSYTDTDSPLPTPPEAYDAKVHNGKHYGTIAYYGDWRSNPFRQLPLTPGP